MTADAIPFAASTGSVSATMIAIACVRLDDAQYHVMQAAWDLRQLPHIAGDIAERIHVICADIAAVRRDAAATVPGLDQQLSPRQQTNSSIRV